MTMVNLGTSGFILRELPLKELSRVKLRRLSRLNTFQRIFRLHVLRDARNACKHESKRKFYKGSDEIAIIG